MKVAEEDAVAFKWYDPVLYCGALVDLGIT